MKLETFFEKFELFADAPDAVAKMRELVLDLAVKGKLTDRDLKKESVSSKYSDEPNSDDLPANWRLLNFGKFCDIQGGNQPPKSQFSDEPRQGYVRMFQIRDLGERPVPVYISKESTNRFCREGEILIGRYGASVGKVFWAQDGAYNVALAKFIFPEDALLPPFAFWVLKSDFFQAEIAGASRSAQAGFNKGDLAAIDFPIPPLAEQKRIVAKVNELMALCDRLEAQQQEREEKHKAISRASLARFTDAPTPANLQFLFHPSYDIAPADLRKTILTLAVQGKLVPQDPNDEQVKELLKRSLAERRKLKRTEATEVPSISDVDALDYDIPESWRWQRLDDLLVFGPTNGFSPKAVDYETPVRSLTLSATTSGCFKGQHSKFITTQVSYDSDLWLHDGDILVQRGNTIEYVGVAAVYRGESNCFVYPDLMMKIRVSAAFDVGYVHIAMSHDASRNFLRARATGTSGSMPKINQATLKNLPLPIPPFAEQKRIVAKVEELMKLVDALETQLTASRTTATNLLAAIVADLTGTPNTDKVSVPASTNTGTGTGRRGRPPKS